MGRVISGLGPLAYLWTCLVLLFASYSKSRRCTGHAYVTVQQLLVQELNKTLKKACAHARAMHAHARCTWIRVCVHVQGDDWPTPKGNSYISTE